MDSLLRTAHLPLLPKPLLSTPPHPLLTPLSSPKPSLSIRASSSRSSSNPISPLIKLASVAAATAAASAALFLARLCPPSLAVSATAFPPAAAAAAASESDTLLSQDSSDTSPITDDADKERLISNLSDVNTLRALVELKIRSGKLGEAIGIVDQLIALLPGDKDFPILKAHLQSYVGDTEAAKRGLEELLEKDPFLVEAYHGLVMAASQSEEDGDFNGIVKRVEDVMKLCKKEKRKEDLREFKLLVAQIKVIEGKYEDSLNIYQELVREEPRDFRPYLCQGIIYTLLRKKDEAEKQFQKYRRLVPKNHPYAQYINDKMIEMKVIGQMDENRNAASKN